MSKFLKINITGECQLFRDDRWGYPVYKAKLSNNMGGTYIYSDIQVELPKDTELPNETYIKINNAFLTFFKRTNGDVNYKIKVTNFDVENKTIGEINIPADISSDAESDLPF